MEKHNKLIKVVKVQTSLLGRRDKTLSLHYLSGLRYRLRLRVGAASFLRKYPHIFHVYKCPTRGGTWFRPLKAFLKAYRELGLPNDFEDIFFGRMVKDREGDMWQVGILVLELRS